MPDYVETPVTFQNYSRKNMIVNSILRNGGSLEDVICALIKRQDELIDELVELKSIAPRRMKIGNKIYRWDCPDELLKVTDMDFELPKNGDDKNVS